MLDPQHLRARGAWASLRRGLVLLGMTVLLPGSAQLVAGNRGVGIVALRVWASLWAGLLGFAALAVVSRDAALAVLSAGFTWSLLQAVLLLLGLAWVLLLVDAWRVARPIDMHRPHRLGFAALSLGLSLSIGSGVVASAGVLDSQGSLVAHVFSGGGRSEQVAGRYNILLLGADAGASRVGLRPDSITVASVDAETGRTVLFSLPRNMEDIPFAEGSPMRTLYPDGYTCPEHQCMLNSVYTEASSRPDLYPGVKDPGAQATKEAVEGITGLPINYYAMVDLKGFEALVDAVGGITLDIGKRVPIGGGTTKIKGYIEPGQDVTLDGYHALWFARSRAESSDFERMQRQKCVMSAMLNQLDPMTVFTQFSEIAGAGEQIVTTDVGGGQVSSLVELADKARRLPIQSVSFTPPLVYPGSPDFALVRATVAHHVEAAEMLDRGEEPGPAPKPAEQPGPTAQVPQAPAAQTPAAPAQAPAEQPTPAPEPAAEPSTGSASSPSPEPEDDNAADDLTAVCGTA
ncbi:LytR family transcriptional regulator [Auraticoccus sp. F435]|uniref:LytR family transcriptional regulator n=1 Tax=Auraticoccus cholistanensis TaxID=2656650 RepID=A0A6A9UV46_9ACTN|nr:LytR family transcriptional regulator [Auraticoccus cholistanensis]